MDHAGGVGGVAPPVLARRAKDLPEEVLRYVMAYSIAVDLARMERVAHTTRRAAQKAAHQRLTAAPWFRNDENEPPTAASTRALRSLELLEARVGPDPRRSWRDEWVDLQFASVRRRLADQPDGQEIMDEIHEMHDTLSEMLRQGGQYAPDRILLNPSTRASVDWKLSQGWDRDAAEGYTLLMTSSKSILGHAFGVNAFAASARTLYGAIQGRAALEGVAPRAFVNVDGEFGLRSNDAVWGALGPDAVVGATFVTNAPLDASACDRCLEDDGFCAPVINNLNMVDVEVAYELQDSDIVCFESKEPDGGGYHSLVRTAETEFESRYDLPPLATVTLVGIDEPGTWTAFGATPNRRLYRVTVTFL